MKKTIRAAVAVLALALGLHAQADEGDEEHRIMELERQVQELREEVRSLKHGGAREGAAEDPATLAGQLAAYEESAAEPDGSFSLGGYGEVHLNFGEGSEADIFDVHRFVLQLGYEFADWISLDAELELEHAAVGEDAEGELVFEQLALDVRLSDSLEVRFGRFLTPVGIVNQRHEPPSFHGVERPTFDRVIVPTTWSSDGLGLVGSLFPWLRFEAYAVAGLDGTGLSATSGFRGARISERPSLGDPGLTARVDAYPFAESRIEHGQLLRVGLSGWHGGLDNGNRGEDPGLNASLSLLCVDFEYTVSSLDFRGVAAWAGIDGAREIGNGAASALLGWYAEIAWHLFPGFSREGALSGSDLVLFVRYEDVDTQFRVPAGLAADPRGDRREITCGATFYLLPNLVLKADARFREDATGEDLPVLLNFGVGWQF